MALRSFSLLLARRYLNPRRSMLSIFSLISLIGVMLGVMVLVVVMAVYAGLERDIKSRLLGSTPHILLQYGKGPNGQSSIGDWREASKPFQGMPGVESTTPFIADSVILDIDSAQKPVSFRSIDTQDAVQVKGIADMLDLKEHPKSSADMGLDDRIVVSSTVATQFGITVGQKVRFYSARNFEKVIDAYKSTEKEPVRVTYANEWNRIKELLKTWKKQSNDEEMLSIATVDEAYGLLQKLTRERIRQPERERLQAIQMALDEPRVDEEAKLLFYAAEKRKAVESEIAELEKTDAEKMDGEILKNLKEVVLPKEAEVIGIYQASQMAIMPDIFMPLPLAQTLSGLDDSVQGIAIRLNDPYKAAEVAHAMELQMGPEWEAITWIDQYRGFFTLISQQRSMMYLALSVIMLVAAFSMTAVMFTVTIQKRREIGVMKALGATSWQIVQVFLYQGMILGLFGAALGVGLGRVIVYFRGDVQLLMRHLGFDPFASGFVGFTVLPAYNDPEEQAMFAIAAFLLCSVAALVPAFFAARSDAAKSLRNL